MSGTRPRLAAVLAATTLFTDTSFAASAQAAGSVVSPAADARSQAGTRIRAAFELPGERVYPEGIAADPVTGDLYSGSAMDGAIFKMTPGRRVAQVLVPAGTDGRRRALGMKVDRSRRLWVVDADAGVSVYDTGSRRLLARFEVTGPDARLVNDLDIASDGSVYITDSLRAVVYRITPRQLALARAHGKRAPLVAAFDLNGVLKPHEPGTVTLNGIAADPKARYLLTADTTGGDLYRIDLPTGAISKVTLSGGDLPHADGMYLRHGRLWVAHSIPTANAISRWRIAPDGRAARLERRLADQALQLPTTLTRRHGVLYVVRSQFDKGGPMGPGTPQTPFTIATVRGI